MKLNAPVVWTLEDKQFWQQARQARHAKLRVVTWKIKRENFFIAPGFQQKDSLFLYHHG